MMTLNRYLLIGKDHKPWLVVLANLEFKWVIRGCLLFSALINIGHGWEYQSVGSSIVMHSIYDELSKTNGYSYSDYPQANQGQAYVYFSIGYFVINFGVFFILNTGIEVKIVRRMHKELQEKRERLAKMNDSKSFSTTAVETVNISQSDEYRKREEEDDKKERRVIKMVILNGVFNFLLRAPDMLFWMENVNTWSVLFNPLNGSSWTGLYMPGLLSFLADIGYLTYILTFTSNFFIFYMFNKNFKDAVGLLWTTKSKLNSSVKK
jgi:hypothetical protein